MSVVTEAHKDDICDKCGSKGIVDLIQMAVYQDENHGVRRSVDIYVMKCKECGNTWMIVRDHRK